MKEILISYLIQILVTIGSMVIFGLLISLFSSLFYSSFGTSSLAVCYITGFIGTPIHECSHALMCLIFGHKIEEMKLFQVSSDDGTLGYVVHSYNPKSLYQKAGNFFIGVAPILVMSTILYFLARWIMPSTTADITALTHSMSMDSFGSIFGGLWSILKAFFAGALSWRWWVFVLVGIFLALHMTLSKADIVGSLSGILIVLIVLLIVNIVLGLIFPGAFSKFNGFMMTAGAYLTSFLLLSLMITMVVALLAKLISLIFRRK